MNLAANTNGATLIARMRKATKIEKRLKYMPISSEMKNRIVIANILPAALYRVEITHINAAAMQELRGAIASAVGSRSAKRSIDLVSNTTDTAKDLDPLVHSLYLRISNLRRIMAESLTAYGQVRTIIKKHNHVHERMTYGGTNLKKAFFQQQISAGGMPPHRWVLLNSNCF